MAQTVLQAKTREQLSNFCEKAAQVAGRRFFAWFEDGQEAQIEFGVDKDTGRFTGMAFSGPDEEDLHALLLTLRMFVIERDGISLEALRRLAANDPALSRQWRQCLVAATATIDQMLSEAVAPEGTLTIPVPTCDAVFKTFLYGEYAHISKQERKRYRKWQQEPCFPLLTFAFSSTVSTLACKIMSLAEVTRHELNGKQ